MLSCDLKTLKKQGLCGKLDQYFEMDLPTFSFCLCATPSDCKSLQSRPADGSQIYCTTAQRSYAG